MSEIVTNRRIVREAVLDAAFNGKSFTIVNTIDVPRTEPKFVAYVTNARGRHGYLIQDDETGWTCIVGLTTLNDANRRGAITNYTAYMATETLRKAGVTPIQAQMSLFSLDAAIGMMVPKMVPNADTEGYDIAHAESL